MDWKGVLVITSSILVLVLTARWWLPSLLSALRGKRITAKWAGKEYALIVEERQTLLDLLASYESAQERDRLQEQLDEVREEIARFAVENKGRPGTEVE